MQSTKTEDRHRKENNKEKIILLGFQDFFFPGLQIKTHSSSMQTAEVNFTQLLGTGFFVTRGGIRNY